MTEPVSIQVSGNVDGNIVVGNNNYVVNTKYGTIINQIAPPQVRPHTLKPQALRPQRGFINRTSELMKLENAIKTKSVLLLHGPNGVGKSALLQQAASLPVAGAMPNGVIILENLDLEGHTLGPNDIIQRLFDILFESDPHLKVNETTARTYLSNTSPLIVMDEVKLSPALQRLFSNLFPKGAMLISAESPDGMNFDELPIGPLPRAEAINLLAAKAQWAVDSINRPTFDKLSSLLGDIPLALVVTGNSIREMHITPDAALQALQPIITPESNRARAALNLAFNFSFGLLRSEEQRALSVVALTPAISMSFEWLSAALGGLEAKTYIEKPKAMGLLRIDGERFGLAPGFLIEAQHIAVLSKDMLMMRLISFLQTSLQTAPNTWQYIENELGNFFGAITWAAENSRTADVIALGRALDPYLTLHGLWDAWGTTIGFVLDAARRSGQRPVEAWALHQLGTRAIGLGFRNQALELLRQAFEIRRSLGDTIGMAYTQHNINLLIAPLVPPYNKPYKIEPPKPKSAGPKWFSLITGIVLVGFMTILAIVAGLTILLLHATPVAQIPATTSIGIGILPTKVSTPVLPVRTSAKEVSPPAPTEIPIFTPTIIPVLNIYMTDINAANSEMPILYQGKNNDDYFEVPVAINIENPNNAQIDNSNISIRFTSNESNETGLVNFRINGENLYQQVKDVRSIKSQIPINLKFSKKYQGKAITLKTELVGCNQEFQCPMNASIQIKIPWIIYDFIDEEHAPQATWTGFYFNQNTALTFPSSRTDPQGSVEYVTDGTLEDGTTPPLVLFTHPSWESANGQVKGIYDDTKETKSPIISGDLLVTRVGFIRGGSDADSSVVFHLGCGVESTYDELLRQKDSENKKLRGGTFLIPNDIIDAHCPFYLKVDTESSSSESDWAAWISAYIAQP